MDPCERFCLVRIYINSLTYTETFCFRWNWIDCVKKCHIIDKHRLIVILLGLIWTWNEKSDAPQFSHDNDIKIGLSITLGRMRRGVGGRRLTVGVATKHWATTPPTECSIHEHRQNMKMRAAISKYQLCYIHNRDIIGDGNPPKLRATRFNLNGA